MSWGGRTADFLRDVAAGHFGESIKSIVKAGLNLDVDSASPPATVWTGGGLIPRPLAARVHSIVSTDAADTAGGAGARTVQLFGLDGNWDEIEETVTLAGLVVVPTVQSFRRINRMVIATAGVTKVNAGQLRATADVDGTLTAVIGPGLGTTLSASWTIPRGDTALLLGLQSSIRRSGNAQSNAQVAFSLHATLGIDGPEPVELERRSWGLSLNGANAVDLTWPAPPRLLGPADVEVRVSSANVNDTVVTAGMSIIYGRVPA